MHGMDLAAWASHLNHVQAGLEAVAAMAGIVAVHARAGIRPRWSRHLPEPFPDIGQNGKPRGLIDEIFVERVDQHGVYYEPTSNPQPGEITFVQATATRSIRKDVYRAGSYCPIVFRPRPEALVRERAEYVGWRMGLEILAGELEGAACLDCGPDAGGAMAAMGRGGRAARPGAGAVPRAAR
jgi:hypothetical protein